MEMRDKVLAFVKAKGPVIPMQVAKDLGKDTFYAGAILSELLNSKIIKISSAKVGGTPVYYFPGQEEKLTMLYNGLPQKEKEDFNLLKEKKKIKENIGSARICNASAAASPTTYNTNSNKTTNSTSSRKITFNAGKTNSTE